MMTSGRFAFSTLRANKPKATEACFHAGSKMDSLSPGARVAYCSNKTV